MIKEMAICHSFWPCCWVKHLHTNTCTHTSEKGLEAVNKSVICNRSVYNKGPVILLPAKATKPSWRLNISCARVQLGSSRKCVSHSVLVWFSLQWLRWGCATRSYTFASLTAVLICRWSDWLENFKVFHQGDWTAFLEKRFSPHVFEC